MSAPRTVLAGLLLGALSASLLQACGPSDDCGDEEDGRCPAAQIFRFTEGSFRWAKAPAPELFDYTFTLEAQGVGARARERYRRSDGSLVETEYEVVRVQPRDASRYRDITF